MRALLFCMMLALVALFITAPPAENVYADQTVTEFIVADIGNIAVSPGDLALTVASEDGQNMTQDQAITANTTRTAHLKFLGQTNGQTTTSRGLDQAVSGALPLLNRRI